MFRAEKHNTTRHLNEYVSLDFEMGYIDGFEDVMAMETGFLQYTMKLLRRDYQKELEMLEVKLPVIEKSLRCGLTKPRNWLRKNITGKSAILLIWSQRKRL